MSTHLEDDETTSPAVFAESLRRGTGPDTYTEGDRSYIVRPDGADTKQPRGFTVFRYLATGEVDHGVQVREWDEDKTKLANAENVLGFIARDALSTGPMADYVATLPSDARARAEVISSEERGSRAYQERNAAHDDEVRQELRAFIEDGSGPRHREGEWRMGHDGRVEAQAVVWEHANGFQGGLSFSERGGDSQVETRLSPRTTPEEAMTAATHLQDLWQSKTNDQGDRLGVTIDNRDDLVRMLWRSGHDLESASMVAAQRIGGYAQVDELDSHDGEWTDASMVRGQAQAVRLSIGTPVDGKMTFQTLEVEFPAPAADIDAFAQRHPAWFGEEANAHVAQHERVVDASLRRAAAADEGPVEHTTERFQDYDRHDQDDEEVDAAEEEDGPDEVGDDPDETLDRGQSGEEPSAGESDPSLDNIDQAGSARPTGHGRRRPYVPLQEAVGMKRGGPYRYEAEDFVPSESLRATDASLADTLAKAEAERSDNWVRGKLYEFKDYDRDLWSQRKFEHVDQPGVQVALPENQALRWERAANTGRLTEWQHIERRNVISNVHGFEHLTPGEAAREIAQDWRHFQRAHEQRPGEYVSRLTAEDGSMQFGIIKVTEHGPDRDGMWVTLNPNGTKAQVANFQDGVLEGQVTNYSRDGRQMETTNYLHGQKHGPEVHYDANGRAKDEATYRRGELVSQRLLQEPERHAPVREVEEDEVQERVRRSRGMTRG